MHHIQLHAISHPVYDLLLSASCSESLYTAQMLARFRRALNLVVGNTVIALVTPELGNGPFHLVVDPLPSPLTGGQHPIWREVNTLHIGPWALHYTQAIHIWEPQPNWSRIKIGHRQQRRLHHAIESVATAKAAVPVTRPESSLSPLMDYIKPLAKAVVSYDLSNVRVAAATLCGLGPGLTPSGDDYLSGAMLALWAGHHPHRECLCNTILEGTAGRTTTLSEAFLAAAAHGEANDQWHTLLLALSAQPDEGVPDSEHGEAYRQIRCAVDKISTYGATSGLDMLAGFEAGLSWCSTATQ